MQKEQRNSRSKPKPECKLPAELAEARKRLESLQRFMQEASNPSSRKETLAVLSEVSREKELYALVDGRLVEHYEEREEREGREGEGKKGRREGEE